MAVPSPIIHLPNQSARHRLVADLYAMGFTREGCDLADAQEAMIDRSPCIYLDEGSDGRPHICRVSLSYAANLFREPGEKGKRTWVNSPSHFLAYLRRHGVSPHDQT